MLLTMPSPVRSKFRSLEPGAITTASESILSQANEPQANESTRATLIRQLPAGMPREYSQRGTPFRLEAVFFSVPEEGLEPSHSCEYWILNPARLPIPPLWLARVRL